VVDNHKRPFQVLIADNNVVKGILKIFYAVDLVNISYFILQVNPTSTSISVIQNCGNYFELKSTRLVGT
jgi:hypothetical protein